jgi:hypothetical protein
MAFASAELELVSGGVTLFVNDNGAVTCAGCTGTLLGDLDPTLGAISIIAANLNGWNITISTGSSNSPNCSGSHGPGCLDNTTINATSTGGSTLTVYFADTGFTSQSSLTVAESASGITGSGSQARTQGFTGTGPLPAASSLSTFSGTQIGTNLNLNAVGSATTSGGGGTTPFDLELVTQFTSGSSGGSFNVDSSISAVPEPVSMLLAGTLFVLVGVGFRRRKVS